MPPTKRFLSAILAGSALLTAGSLAFAAGNAGFSDVPASVWYADAVQYVSTNNLMSGTSASRFEPETNTSRAMLAAILYRAAGSPPVSGDDSFRDTSTGAWYSDAVNWAFSTGVVSGYGDGRFGTNDPVSREQMASILWRWRGSPEAGSINAFADAEQISDWASDAVNWARSTGVMSGRTGNRFDPKAYATRAEVASVLRGALTQAGANGTAPAEPTSPPETQKPRILIAYFTRANNVQYDNSVDAVSRASLVVRDGELVGNNGIIAQYIQEEVGGDLFSIERAEPYPLDYDENVAEANDEQDQDARPALKNRLENLSDYDIIFLGTPNWWGDMPMPMYTFLDEYDFSGKTIVPFNTHRGSGFRSLIESIAEAEPNAEVIRDGFSVYGEDLEEQRQAVKDWIDGLNIR